MSASEFAFLALGLILGVAAGAAIIVVLRSRPPSPREVRLTVTPDSIPRRAATLNSTDAGAALREPARGGPGSNGDAIGPSESESEAFRAIREMAANRTIVQPMTADVASPGAIATARPAIADPALGGPALTGAALSGAALSGAALTGAALGSRREPLVLGPALSTDRGNGTAPALVAAAVGPRPAMSGTAGSEAMVGGTGRGLVGIEVHGGASESSDASVSAGSLGIASTAPVSSARPGPASGNAPRGAFADSGSLVRAADDEGSADAGSGPAAAAGSLEVAQSDLDACSAERRIAEERCGNADRLAGLATAAQAALREAQVTADKHQMRATEAATRADPRAIRAAKEAAQQTFRAARSAATTRDGVESAARAWLSEINRINREAREATLSHRREQDAANALLPTIERLSVDADAARITAEAAREACLAAREALATCEEAAARARRDGARLAAEEPVAAAAPLEPALAGIGAPARLPDDAGSPALVAAEGTPALFRLLRGDREVMRHVVDELSGGDPAERRRWQLQLSDLVDALLARAIESSSLDFPEHHQFWGMFNRTESRDIAAALSSLGYRFDGLGGFVDGRIPSQRDLSLAVGYAGLDPMRIRRWPNEAEMPALFGEVTVAADEYVAGAAGNFTLGDLVTVLGRRADGLADLWNAWGRVRPLLVATSIPV